MILFSNGCSFLTPRPKDGIDTFTTKIIAEKYGMQLENLAMGGRGNTRVSFSSKVWFEQNKDKDVFAVIGWSSAVRNDYITNDGWKKGRITGTDLTWRTWKTLDNVSFIKNNRGWDIENNLAMNFLDNPVAVQFVHRCLAWLICLFVGLYVYKTLKHSRSIAQRNSALFLCLAIFVQFSLGVATLLYSVPISLASMHQGGAVLLFIASLLAVIQNRRVV